MEQNISGRKSERCCLPCAALLKLTRTMARNPSLPSRQRRFVLHPAVVTKGSRVRKLRNEVKPKTWEFSAHRSFHCWNGCRHLSNRYENVSALEGLSKQQEKSLHPLGAEDVSVHTCTYVLVSTSRCMETNLFMKNAFRQLWRRITFQPPSPGVPQTW